MYQDSGVKLLVSESDEFVDKKNFEVVVDSAVGHIRSFEDLSVHFVWKDWMRWMMDGLAEPHSSTTRVQRGCSSLV